MGCKNDLHPEQIYVERARDVARKLVQQESRGPGDTDNAMRRIEERYGVPYAFLWSLRYRPPKDILMGPWTRLVAAYRAECERVERLARLEREKIGALEDATSSSMDRLSRGAAAPKMARAK